jgi:proline iminopeptidase
MEWNPWVASLARTVGSLHARLFRLFGRTPLLGRNVLVLTTRGRRSGRETTTALFYVEQQGKLYVVASFGGSDTPPGWYRNLVKAPEVGVETRTASGRYRARPLTPAEAEPIWPALLTLWPAYADYQKRTARVIPVVELAPTVTPERR